MAKHRGNNEAFGKPGIEPRWTHGNKTGIGTAYSASSLLWFTLWEGFVTELYYPTVDRPQTRDLQYLVTDGESFYHDELRHLEHKTTRLSHALGYKIVNKDPEGCYQIEKQIIAAPHSPCLIQHTKVTGDDEFISNLKIYALLAPHLEVGGWGNSGYVMESDGRTVLVANKNDVWLAMAADVEFSKASCGFVGESDGWTDISDNFQMDNEFDRAEDGNIALTGEIDLSKHREWTLGVAFGTCLNSALTNLFQELGIPFETQLKNFEKQWQVATDNMLDLSQYSGDKGKCYQTSYNVLMSHEDKTYKGAMIASLSIPWGEIRDDEGGEGGYHLVWTRDMVNSSTGLIAAGNYETAYRSLVFLATSQLDDGSFPQNFWINGEPYWSGLQLDEVSTPIILAHKLWKDKELKNFDPYHLITGAASFLIKKGPSTKQERWEEAAGYSPSTLASMIAALVCAGDFVRDRGEKDLAGLFESYADFLEANIENWTITENGTLHEKVKKHYVRINPIEPGESLPENGVSDDAILSLANQEPDTQSDFPAKEIVDAGFLELVRYGIREPKSKLIVDSLKVCDSILKVETPNGTCWKRYNHDGYGQREDGSAYDKWGTGRGWILLAGERGHYELASGNKIQTFIKDLENFSNETGLLSEQVWDAEDIPDKHLYKGEPTGAAMPLAWAHSEYIKLLRSSKDGKVFDRIDAVAERYLEKRDNLHKTKFWSFNAPAQTVKRNETLRIIAEADFELNWSCNDEEEQQTIEASKTSVGIFYVDIKIPKYCSEIGFRFYWIDADEIAEENYSLDVKD